MNLTTPNADRPNRLSMRRWLVRSLLVLGSLLGALMLAELALTVADRPKSYKARKAPPQFSFMKANADGPVFYVNIPSTKIRFEYDGNPRGYFGRDNEVEHQTNSSGFRGADFTKVNDDTTLRLMFLGDSFTFGEGVRDDDVYPVLTAALLGEQFPRSGVSIAAFNLGVGGYNTSQSAGLLKMFGKSLAPDVVVLGYVLNDAEPPLFHYDAKLKRPVRRHRQVESWKGGALGERSGSYWSRLRTFELVAQSVYNRQRSDQVMAIYRALYHEPNRGWQESRRALRQIIGYCESQNIPCCVIVFPVLYRLDEDYPLLGIHRSIQDEVSSQGGVCIDLFPSLRGRNPEDLWVHPTDQHPNEIVHRIVAEILVHRLAQLPEVRERLSGRRKTN